jgi:fructose-1,6-bisphosphatase I
VPTQGLSLSRYFAGLERDRLASPDLATLILQMAFASKVLAREVRRAALVGKLGLVGDVNPTGDSQKKLDVYSNEVVVDAFSGSGLVAAIVSEEMEELKTISCESTSQYILCVDPLDGSSNTDINGTVGTIFSFYHRDVAGPCEDVEGELRETARLVAAGYVMYGPSTLLVFGLGGDVNGFTLDQGLGEYLLSHESIRCPARGYYYSANLGNYHDWTPGVRSFADYLIERDPDTGRPYSLRYSGAMVADLHRSLLEGGIYFYPADGRHPNGKLRLLYECAPMAFLTEAAGGRASTGSRRILDIRPQAIHQTVPLAIGSREIVSLYDEYSASQGT